MSGKSIAVGFPAALFFWVMVILMTIDVDGSFDKGPAAALAVFIMGLALWGYASFLHDLVTGGRD